MRFRLAARWLLPVVCAAIAIAGGLALSGHAGPQRSGMARALALLPQDTRSVGYTNWSRVADAVNIDPTSPASREEFDALARERDLTTRSVLAGRSQDLYAAFGWTLGDLDWDAYGQTLAGNILVIGLGADLSASSMVESLQDAGYQRSGDIWQAKSDDFRRAHPDLPDELNNVAVVNERTLLAGTRPGYLDDVRGESGSAADNRGIRHTANAVRGATTALIQDGKLGCDASGFSNADETTVQAARAAIVRGGRLRAYRALARSIDAQDRRQSMRFAMAFESPAAATQQVDVRRALTSGSFIGRGGQIEDALRLRSARADGGTAVLRFDYDESADAFMAAVGPIIFAACPLPS